jgi:hypothetical protein
VQDVGGGQDDDEYLLEGRNYVPMMVTQVTAIGPLGLEYHEPADYPRVQARQTGPA